MVRWETAAQNGVSSGSAARMFGFQIKINFEYDESLTIDSRADS